MRTLGLIALCAVLTTTPATAQDTPIPQAEIWSRSKVEQLGRAIHEQDVAAARGSDALMQRLGSQPSGDLVGWIVIRDGRGQLVRFLRQRNGVLSAAYDIPVVNGRAGAVREAPAGVLPSDQAAMFEARRTAAKNIGEHRCTPRYNAVVLNDPDSDGWLVWLLASTNVSNQLVMTGHHRFRISGDGKSVLMHDALSVTCIVQNVPPEQRDLVALNISHLVSPEPVETHVFTSLNYGLPVYVVAGDSLFSVDGARIREVRR